MQLLQSDRGRHCDRRERNDLGRIAACITFRHSKVAMLGLESMPHRIFEEAIGQIVHSTKTYTSRLTHRRGSPGRDRAM